MMSTAPASADEPRAALPSPWSVLPKWWIISTASPASVSRFSVSIVSLTSADLSSSFQGTCLSVVSITTRSWPRALSRRKRMSFHWSKVGFCFITREITDRDESSPSKSRRPLQMAFDSSVTSRVRTSWWDGRRMVCHVAALGVDDSVPWSFRP